MPSDTQQSVNPIISVMIPTWNPRADYLKEAIDSVLMQDWGPKKMQIAIVDDFSSEVDVKKLLKEWDYLHRIEFHQNETNRGIGGNWNSCIEQSRGEYLHILHQDDLVLEGFYEELIPALYENEEVGMVINRTQYLSHNGLARTYSRMYDQISGVKKDLILDIHELDIQCPGVIVKKKVFQETGYFREDLQYSLDRLKWTEIVSKYDVWYEPKPLNCFRINMDSQSARLMESGENTLEFINVIDEIILHVPENYRPLIRKQMKKKATAKLMDMAKTKGEKRFRKYAWKNGDRKTFIKKTLNL
jgi:glycosyltransferase involved in cell wall biosynthesis